MKITVNKVAFIVATLALAFRAYPTGGEKQAGGLHLGAPVETPNGVHFSWTGGNTNSTYSIYRKLHGDTYWERISMGLPYTGAVTVEGFTLDRTYDYEMRGD